RGRGPGPAVAVHGGHGRGGRRRAGRHVPHAGGEAPAPARRGRELRAGRQGHDVVRPDVALLAPRREPAVREARPRRGVAVARRRRRRRREGDAHALPPRCDHGGDAAVPAGAVQREGGGRRRRAPGRRGGARRVVRQLLRVRDGADGEAVGRGLPRVLAGAMAPRRRRVRGRGRGAVPGVPRRAEGVPREGDGVRADEDGGGSRAAEVQRRGGGAGSGHGIAAGVRDDGDDEDEGRAVGAAKEAGIVSVSDLMPLVVLV
ncbi:Os05g0382500, partial [Oryza sativa Japonica Group]